MQCDGQEHEFSARGWVTHRTNAAAVCAWRDGDRATSPHEKDQRGGKQRARDSGHEHTGAETQQMCYVRAARAVGHTNVFGRCNLSDLGLIRVLVSMGMRCGCRQSMHQQDPEQKSRDRTCVADRSTSAHAKHPTEWNRASLVPLRRAAR
jgi:hypothetical protein